MGDEPLGEARRLREAVSTLMRVFLVDERRFPVAGTGERYSPHDFQTLAFLARTPGARLGSLAAFLAVSPTTATSVVDRLVRRGLVRRRTDPSDGRARALALTAAGTAMADAILAQDLRNMTAALGTLEPAERAAFVAMMERIAARLSLPEEGTDQV